MLLCGSRWPPRDRGRADSQEEHPYEFGLLKLGVDIRPRHRGREVGYWEREWRGRRVWETGWSVLPEFQGRGVATSATAAVVERARAEGKHRFIHAFPSVDNGPSNAICGKVGFTLQEEVDFEYPPGNFMRCNNWRLDLFADPSETP